MLLPLVKWYTITTFLDDLKLAIFFFWQKSWFYKIIKFVSGTVESLTRSLVFAINGLLVFLLVFNYVKMYESLSWSIKVDLYAKSWRYCAFIDNVAFAFPSMLVGSSCSNKDPSRERKLIYIASIQIIILEQRTKLYWLKHSTIWNIDNQWITHR